MAYATRSTVTSVILIWLLAPAGAAEEPEAEPSVLGGLGEEEQEIVDRAGRWRLNLEGTFQAGFPQGDLEGGTGYGLTLFAGAGVPHLPLVLGAEVGFLTRGRDDERVDEGRVSAVSDVLMAHLVARLQSSRGRFRPYLDGLFGLKYFETITSTGDGFSCFDSIPGDGLDECPPGSDSIDSKKSNSDTALSYGLGAGFDIMVFSSDSARLSIVVGARYLWGEKARYVVPSSVEIVDADEVEFEKTRTRTDIVTARIGLGWHY